MGFKEEIEKKRAAASSSTTSKDVSEMTEAEMDAEEDRLRSELRTIREEELRATRQAVEQQAPGVRFLPKKRRRPWK